ncbi:MAG: hypothetical protein MZU91_10600 [Desulfosudis oleivorans]|nr:hypothetical protein [Desulfosudis oleivorans]
MTIASHLVLEGVRWRDGIPYSQGLAGAARHLCGGPGRRRPATRPREASRVAAEAPSDLRIQASLTAASGGFPHRGHRQDGRAPRRPPRRRLLRQRERAWPSSADDRAAAGEFPANAPLTAASQLAFYALRVLAWKEY